MSPKTSLSCYYTLIVLVFVSLISGVFCAKTNSRKENSKKSEQGSCSALRNFWTSKGFEASQLPKLSMKNESLQICGQGLSCCSSNIEDKLFTTALSEISLDHKLEKLKQTLSNVAVRYNSFCIDLINKSAIDLDDMFQKTYGELYKQESHIFVDLFNQLRLYYVKGRDLDLIRVFDRFFRTLMQKMFALLNAHYSFDDRYLKCVVENMDDLRPFHDVPQKLSNQVKRAMVAARTFHDGLKVGKEFVANVQKAKLPQTCLKEYSRMTICPSCGGINNIRPCTAYCSDVMNNCYAVYKQLDQPWNNYLDQMRKVMERLEGSFHLVGIISPINVKISEAIMNYQERNEDVNKKVFIGCGEPSLGGRSKRSIGHLGDGSHRVKRSMDRVGSVDLDKILQEVRDKLISSNDIFGSLADTACIPLLTAKNSKAASNSTNLEDNCWNGTARARYSRPKEEQPTTEVVKMASEMSKDEQMFKQQVEKLTAVAMKLTKSFEGLDVMQEEDAEGSGGNDSGDTEGSGGSGFEDDEDYQFTTPTPPRRNPYHEKGSRDKIAPVPYHPVTPKKVPHFYPTTRVPYSRTYNSASSSSSFFGWHLLFLHIFLHSFFTLLYRHSLIS